MNKNYNNNNNNNNNNHRKRRRRNRGNKKAVFEPKQQNQQRFETWTNSGARIRQNILELDELLSKKPEDIILSFRDPRFRIADYLNAPTMTDQAIRQLTVVFTKAFNCNSIQSIMRQHVESIVESLYFTRHLYEAITNNSHHTHNYYFKNEDNQELIELVMIICIRFLYLQPACYSSVTKMKERIQLLLVKKFQEPKLKGLFNALKFAFQEALNRNKKVAPKRRGLSRSLFDYTGIEPPEDFTQLNVVPTLDDILSQQTSQFLRKNITNQAYKDVNHYLDVQFRLLREDFLQPLRDGVRQLGQIITDARLEQKSGRLKLTKSIRSSISSIDSLSVYFDCSLEGPIVTDFGLVYEVCLDANKAKSINWKESKRLIFGSLVCLSDDFFEETCLVATVCDRDRKRPGVIMVKLDSEHDQETQSVLSVVRTGGPFIMLETSAFFESYKHVLNALVAFRHDGEENFPFRENLVYCRNQTIPMPDYLAQAYIDFSCLTNSKYLYHASQSYTWPNAAQMGLDQDQYDAIKLTLQNKLAIIQGPPGTGKTFVSVQIVKLLMNNKDLWWNQPGDDRRRPILMVCYTNHALDQFLEKCIDQCGLTDGVVRVGGRCQSTKLENFKLSTIKKNMKTQNRRGRSRDGISRQIAETYTTLARLRSTLDYKIILLKYIMSEIGVLDIQMLGKFMTDEHYKNFQAYIDNLDVYYGEINDIFLEWLGFFDRNIAKYSFRSSFKSTPTAFEIDDQDGQENVEVFDWNDVDDDDANNERMLEEDILRNQNRSNNTRKKNQRKGNNKSSIVHQTKNKIILFEEIRIIRRNQLQVNDYDEKENAVKGETLSDYYQEMKRQAAEINEIQAANVLIEVNLNRLDYVERFVLYSDWYKKCIEYEQHEIEQLSDEYNRCVEILNELHMQQDRCIMQDAYIVAMTTTGSARLHSVLKDMGARIVIIEEAAEVFESHIVASLSKHCEHLILIGDHVQLRPNPTVYKLAKDFQLDVSLFERLINNNAKKVMLKNQRRMRPEISLLVHQFYDQPILDDPSTKNRKSIVGLRDNVFFVNHSVDEDRPRGKNDANTSKINKFEAKYLTNLTQYLLNQKQFRKDQITILSMYLGQTNEIKKLLRDSRLNEVKCTTVDNFQGEENEIIILSLVRSNKEGRIGFLDIKNRCCVALSRARIGFYIIGNLDFICKNEKNGEWTKIAQTLRNQNCVDKGLTLSCWYHPYKDLLVTQPDQFNLRMDYVCQEICNARLPKCAHTCPLKCHKSDREHSQYVCMRPCEKIIPRCGHSCQRVCLHSFYCDICPIVMVKEIRECGHRIEIRCDKEPTRADCRLACSMILRCGHMCKKMCAVRCEPCEQIVVKKNPACGHPIEIRCCQVPTQADCLLPCDRILSCGHQCKNMCAVRCGPCEVMVIKKTPECGHPIEMKCCDKPSRADCRLPCERILPCGHKCTKICADKCQPCEMLIQVPLLCQHGGCVSIKCGSSDDEIRRAKYSCEHPCEFKLSCGHVCPNKCSQCYGGHIHGKCAQKCNQRLFCDHPCQISCSNDCQPCTLACETRCSHSKCRFKCSEPCVPCQEPCSYKCPHYKCTKKCYKICNRPPCNKPCQLKNPKCGIHGCMGYCGEPCPLICTLCDADQQQDRTDSSLSKARRYVLLEDCGHSIDSVVMEEWLDAYLTNNTSIFEKSWNLNKIIEMPSCPTCKTPIRRNLRYSKYLKTQKEILEKIKLKLWGDPKENNEIFQKLEYTVTQHVPLLELNDFSNGFVSTLTNALRSIERPSLTDLIFYTNTWNLFLRYQKLFDDIKRTSFAIEKQIVFEVKRLETCFVVATTTTTNNQQNSLAIVHNSARQMAEISLEINRISVVFRRLKDEAERARNSTNRRSILDSMFGSAAGVKTSMMSRFEDDFEQLKNLFKSNNANKMSASNIGSLLKLEPRIWHQCKIGHIFTTTNEYTITSNNNCIKLTCSVCEQEERNNSIIIISNLRE